MEQINELTPNKSYAHLKSGTDIRGVAIETKDAKITLTPGAIQDITRAFLKWVSIKTDKPSLNIAVGKDSRLSSDDVFESIQQVMMISGCNVIYCDLATTPSMYLLLKESDWECDASIMITASHQPSHMNGLKFFTPEGGLTSEEMDEVLAMAAAGEQLPRKLGNIEEASFMDDYCKKLINVVRKGTGKSTPLFGKRIIVDASNGCGGFFAKKVLPQLGAITEGSVNLAPDGRFPSHVPNPENDKAIAYLRNAVLKADADLGIIFDTDVDRAAMVDGTGKLINRDSLIALTAATLLESGPATIVTDSVTCDGLTKFIEERGGTHVRYKRGYQNVIGEAKRLNAHGHYCPLAIETSGHAAFSDNYFLDDGAYLICKMLVAYANQIAKRETLADLISDLVLPTEEKEIRVQFNEESENFRREGIRVIDELNYFTKNDPVMSVAPNNHEGVRINFPEECGSGWALVRPSVHDPVLVINLASREKGGVFKMAKKLFYMLDKYPFLDIENLVTYLNEKK